MRGHNLNDAMNAYNHQIQNKTRSYLMLIGGAEDKTGDKIVLKKIIQTARAKNIVIIPSASNYPRDIEKNYYYSFKDLGVKNIHTFDIRHRDEAGRNEYFTKLAAANLVFFSGGDQVKLVNTFENTELLDEIKRRFYNGTLSVAGTSAGAAAVSDPMIFDGDNEGFVKGSVKYQKGFGFLENITIDTHFVTRGRILRLSQFLSSGLSYRGIGLGEDTAIIINPSLRFEVVGSGLVTVLTRDKTTFTNYQNISDYELLSTNNLRLGLLAPGTTFSIKRWSVLRPKTEIDKTII